MCTCVCVCGYVRVRVMYLPPSVLPCCCACFCWAALTGFPDPARPPLSVVAAACVEGGPAGIREGVRLRVPVGARYGCVCACACGLVMCQHGLRMSCWDTGGSTAVCACGCKIYGCVCVCLCVCLCVCVCVCVCVSVG